MERPGSGSGRNQQPQQAQSPQQQQQQQQQRDPSLNFFSPRFDAARSLATAGLLPPVPGARPLDNIYRCRFMLPEDHPDFWKDPGRAAKSKEAAEAAVRAQSRVHVVQAQQQRKELKVNPIDEIAERVRKGPLLLLKACYQQRRRVRVVTRHAHGVRGSAEGTLVAFDKHLNLVLKDAEESYTVLLRVRRVKPPAPGGNGRERVRWVRQQEHRRRQLKQVFVRGDSVVLVAAAAASGTPTAAAAAAAGGVR
ncbi:U7 snRNA-associated Sm LSm11 [Micractinium conductrix]|uniref:U7 snRNA-associated Sm LSm11 n=1 Tax=Micractinium conductrix TaxID=554055 RepID=A0A2P6VD21_9CHLO|nr:U7 snRNA-associated Sm LSm11 [Micractinium conductrix]|eukprot:PSC71977.1 U7 snRNA-associated Sm LSm11 [Micractinium conductrix]